VQHVSAARTLELIRAAKQRGLPVSCEVTPHHFTLADEDLTDYDTNKKMMPPVRTKKDREALRAGLADGTVNAIATDHAPHAPQDKQTEFDQAKFGCIGIETLLPLCLNLVRKKIITLRRMVELLTVGPAEILGLNAGTLTPGADADIVVFDPNKEWRITAENFFSKARNCPYTGWDVTGHVVRTFVRGRKVFELA
jgi:dihydroorotase